MGSHCKRRMKKMKIHSQVIDHGIPIQAEESRTAAICINEQGEERFVIAARGFVMVINPETEKYVQLFFPEDYVEYPFASFSSHSGLFYTGAGKMLMVLDPFKEHFVDYQWIENGEEIVGFSFAEDANGQIYATTYPTCHLLQYCPLTKKLRDYGSMDHSEKYAGSMAVDEDGWIYAGIGTEHKNVIAFHPETQQKLSFVVEQQRTRGAGYVYKGINGYVYGHWEAENLKDVNFASKWRTFSNGKCSTITSSDISPSLYSGLGFNKIHRNGLGTYRILEHSLSEGYVVFTNDLGEINRINFSYQSQGADLSTLYIGPDRYLYASSKHPLHFFRYDFDSGSVTNFGAQVIEKGGGGNIVAYAAQGSTMVGFAYAGGKIYEFNLKKPISESSQNPKLISEHELIHRPRCAISHPDGKHIIWGGYPGYGMAGGGLGIYHVESKINTIIPHTSIVQAQSTVCLGVLRSGNILGGTSVETPGGASTKDNEGFLYLLDWERKEIVYKINPIPGSREISQLFIDKKERAHCLSIEGTYFVFDPYEKTNLFSVDLSVYGIPVRNGFVLNEKGTHLYCLLSDAILAVDMSTDGITEPKVIARLDEPATSGIAYDHGKIYFGCGSNLYSIQVE